MKVFLSYPSEHLGTARAVKNFVRSVGIECWFDKDDLIAGQDWDRARSIALGNAEVVIVLCAAQTIERNGVYQREINEALKHQADKRLGVVYIIPVRIDESPLPPELTRLQYVNYFDLTWRRSFAAGLARAVTEQGEEIPATLEVAAAQPDEGGIIPHEMSQDLAEGSLQADWLTYAMNGDYWDFVNGLIRVRALGGLYEARRQFSEWWQPSGSSWELHLSEFYRKGQLVSLKISTFSYFSNAAYPNYGIQSINILGEDAGVVTATDIFEATDDGLKFLTEYVNLDLRRQYGYTEDEVDISRYADMFGWNLFDHFNFNEAGMQLNLSSMSGLPHVLGQQEVYLPWQHVEQFLTKTAKRILLKSE